MYVCMYVRIYVCMYVCRYVRMYVCMQLQACLQYLSNLIFLYILYFRLFRNIVNSDSWLRHVCLLACNNSLPRDGFLRNLHTLGICNTFCFSASKSVTNTSLIATLYVRCLYCLDLLLIVLRLVKFWINQIYNACM